MPKFVDVTLRWPFAHSKASHPSLLPPVLRLRNSFASSFVHRVVRKSISGAGDDGDDRNRRKKEGERGKGGREGAK